MNTGIDCEGFLVPLKRSVRLSKVSIKALIKHKSLQENNNYGLVFPNNKGEPRRSGNVLLTGLKRRAIYPTSSFTIYVIPVLPYS
jgi:hypothetical protein